MDIKTDPDFAKAIHFERVKTLYEAAETNGLLSSFLVIIFVPLFMWDRVDHRIILYWTAGVSLVNICRAHLLTQFRDRLKRNQITKDNALVWEMYFVAGIAMTGFVWSATIFFPFKEDVLASMLYILVIYVGINAAIASMYMASRKTTIVYLVITLMPTFMRIAWEGDRTHIVIALLGIVFISRMGSSICFHSSNLVETIELKLLNEQLSKKDALTGLWNRRQLYDFIEKLIPTSNRHSLPFCVMLLDIDFFKKYNDSNGHIAGDHLLTKVAQIISTNIRSEDLAIRYGGEEFMVIFVGMELAQASNIAERLRVTIKKETAVTISSGLVEYEPGVSFTDLTARADSLLYTAKKSGRNKTVFEEQKTAMINSENVSTCVGCES